jgi:hypothetical protein
MVVEGSNMTQKLIRGSYIQHVLGGNRLDELPELEKQILTRFGYNYRNPPPTYQIEGFITLIYFLRDTLFTETSLTDDEKFGRIGYFSSKSFFASPAGQVILPVLRIVGVTRGIHNFLTRMNNIFPWADFRLEEIHPNCCCISYRPLEVPPTLIGGSLRANLEQMGLKNIEITTTSMTSEYHRVTATWTKR